MAPSIVDLTAGEDSGKKEKGVVSTAIDLTGEGEKTNLVARKRKLLSSSSMTPNLGGRFFWDGSDGVSLDRWIRAIRPSRFTALDCAWIQVDNITPSSAGYCHDEDLDEGFQQQPYMPGLNRISEIISSGKGVTAAEKQKCVSFLLETAKKQGCTVGKWMLFVHPTKADDVWKRVSTATANGLLGCSAKIAPAKGREGKSQRDQPVVCCIYVQDCTRRPEVKRVLLALQNMQLKVTCGFKPDFYTSLGIYQKNPWRLKPTLYSVKEVLDW